MNFGEGIYTNDDDNDCSREMCLRLPGTRLNEIKINDDTCAKNMSEVLVQYK